MGGGDCDPEARRPFLSEDHVSQATETSAQPGTGTPHRPPQPPSPRRPQTCQDVPASFLRVGPAFTPAHHRASDLALRNPPGGRSAGLQLHSGCLYGRSTRRKWASPDWGASPPGGAVQWSLVTGASCPDPCGLPASVCPCDFAPSRTHTQETVFHYFHTVQSHLSSRHHTV